GPAGADTPRLDDVADRVSWAAADFTDAAAVASALAAAAPALVFHLAGAIALSPAADAAALAQANVTATAAVVAGCAGLPDLRLCVHTGTCAEYGDLREDSDEGSPVAPTTAYGATKAAATVIARTIAGERGVPLAVLRPYNLYGEWEAPARLVPHVALSLLEGRKVPLTGGEQAKDYLYVGDLARAYLAAAASADAATGGVFNVASGECVTVREVVEALCDALGADRALLRFGEVPYRENEMWRQSASVARIRTTLRWEPAQTLASGMAVTAAWYRDNRGLYGR
ncbi:MAG: NAD-dependent epimerase/dehydratase family protein, partial [Actinobacteria bacterium]